MTRLRKFRLQFLETPTACDRPTFPEESLAAADLDSAVRAAAAVSWPTGIRACRLSNLHGGEVAYRFKADPDGAGPADERAGMIVKFS